MIFAPSASTPPFCIAVTAISPASRTAHQESGATGQAKIVTMILGIGTDLAEVHRIRESIERFGARFVNRVYTERERAYASSKANAAERFAARFAAKEAGMKAIGTGWNHGVRWVDFEVVNERSGRPTLQLHGVAAEVARKMGANRISISLTHTVDTAFAVVILEDGA